MSTSTDDPAELLRALRQRGPTRASACALLSAWPDASNMDLHSALRAQVTALLLQTLAPTDHSVVAWLLTQEITAHRAAGHGASEALVSLVAAVARFGSPEDALLLWRAHAATPETYDAVEVEHLGRAGVARVRTWLQAQARAGGSTADDARSALAWLDAGQASGAFDNLAAYFAWSDEINGLTTGAPV